MIDVDKAIPLGLVVNELVSNAFKHAFADNPHPELWLKLKDENGKMLLEVNDNGCGLPTDFDLRSTKSFGMKMVKILIRQLKGKIEIKKSPGTGVMVEI